MKKILWIAVMILVLCVMAVAPAEDGGAGSFWEDAETMRLKERSLFAVEAYNNRDECVGRANGFLAGSERLFVTSLSVTEGASYLCIRHADGSVYRLNLLLAMDREHDLAVFSFPDAGKYPALPLETTEDLQPDQPVILMIRDEEDVTVEELCEVIGFPERSEFAGAVCIQFSDTGSHTVAGGILFDDTGRLAGIAANPVGDEPYTGIAVPAEYLIRLLEPLSPDNGRKDSTGSTEPAEETAGKLEMSEEDAQLWAAIEGEWNIADMSFEGMEDDLIANLQIIREAGGSVLMSFHDGKMSFIAEFMGERMAQDFDVEIVNGQIVSDGEPADILLMGDTLILLEGNNSFTLVRPGTESGEASPEEEPGPQHAYVSANSVNVRELPEDDSAKVMNLTKYAYITVLETVENDGKEWLRISFGEKEGYLRSVFVTRMNAEEDEAFLQSPEYAQGLEANPQ